jgi:hypothetical protein
MDKNDTSKADIEKIFEDVELVDRTYEKIFTNLFEAVKSQVDLVQKMAELINPPTKHLPVQK